MWLLIKEIPQGTADNTIMNPYLTYHFINLILKLIYPTLAQRLSEPLVLWIPLT